MANSDKNIRITGNRNQGTGIYPQIVFTGASGSTYRVYPHTYRLSLTTLVMLTSFRESVQNTGIELEMLPDNTDWLTLDYSTKEKL